MSEPAERREETPAPAPSADAALKSVLDDVSGRYRRLLLSAGLAAGWALLALAGAGLLYWARGRGYAVPGAALAALLLLPLLAVPLLLSALRAVRSPLWIARRIEKRHPELDARLLAAVEQRPDEKTGQLSYLQQTVIEQAVAHAARHRWAAVVPGFALRGARLAQWAMLIAFAAVLLSLVLDIRRRPGRGGFWAGGAASLKAEPFDIKVEPGNTEIERGTGLLVMARFGGEKLPGDVQLLYRDGTEGEVRQVPMSKALDDPLFAARVGSVARDLTYSVRYGDNQTGWYSAKVFDYPDLRQADAKLRFPEYTGMGEKVVEDTRSVTAVEGTKTTFTFRLNKPVAKADLVAAAATGAAAQGKEDSPSTAPAGVKLTADPKDPAVYTVDFDLKQSQRYKLQLVDAQGRGNKQPPELAINVTPNNPPELKVVWPGHDVDVSPLEELALKAQVWDDFGVKKVGLSYGIAGKEPKDLTIAESVPGKEKRDVAQLVSLEKLDAAPDELLSYFFWAEDVGPDGKVRRTQGDMFFAEVRPFEQIFRQGQQPSAGEQQEQQQQNGQNGQQAEQLAELQKQIIAATWKVVRREKASQLTPQFVPDVKTVSESQGSAKEQAEALGEKLQDERSKAYLKNVLKYMEQAVTQLDRAAAGPVIEPLTTALSSEQAAYQELLKLRAREVQVVRGNQRQRGGSQSSAQNRRQQQLNQLQLDNEQNRYENQRQAQQQQEDPGQRETRQVLSRLRELAQRQEDLNKQMRELQSALEAAQDEQKREEIKRQLARLRDQQQQMLRDTDELRDRMDQPENQQRMADSRQQLEETRDNIRKASEALQQGQVPQAQSSGARAGEQLNNLRDQFRKSAAGQFNEAMNQMRQDARELDRSQQELSQKLNEADKTEQRSLRGSQERKQVTDALAEQKQRLQKLLDEMRQTSEQAEAPEPLLSKQLYDTLRDAHHDQTEQALDASRQMLERGFVNEARQTEGEAGKAITKLREGVEKAADSVLGDEAEALRRAKDELANLSNELDREIARNQPGGGPTTGPATAPSPGRRQLAQNTPTTRGADPERGADTQPGEDGQRPDSERADAQGPEGRRQPGQRSASRAGERQGQRQEGQQQEGQQPGGQQEGNSQQANRQPGGQQPGGQQPGQQQGGQPQGGDQPGEQAGADGQPNDRVADAQGGRQRGGQPRGGQRPGGLRTGQQRPGGDLRQFLEGPDAGATGPGEEIAGPFTGGNFRNWSDRLRDVEEMVGDRRLRAEAARIRDRARGFRNEMNRHAQPPNWDLVKEFVGRPLVELRDQVSQELLKRESSEARVPIDREPVPPEYAEQVRRYYERLGSGK